MFRAFIFGSRPSRSIRTAKLACVLLSLLCCTSVRASALIESYEFAGNQYLIAADPNTGFFKKDLFAAIAAPLTGLAYGNGELYESYEFAGNQYLIAADPNTGFFKKDLFAAIAAPLTGLAYEPMTTVPLPSSLVLLSTSLTIFGIASAKFKTRRTA